MATKNFTEFNTATPLTSSDYIVGYKADGSVEIKTQVKDIINLASSSDSQTLSFNEGNKNLTISSGNTVSLSSLSDTAFQSASSSFATNTTVNNVSSLLTPLILTNTLTGQLVTNIDFNNYQTSVANSTATLLPTTIYQNASGNWQSTYTTYQSNSSFYVQSRSTLETPTTGISAVSNIVFLTQATYNDLTVKLPTTMYVIVSS